LPGADVDGAADDPVTVVLAGHSLGFLPVETLDHTVDLAYDRELFPLLSCLLDCQASGGQGSEEALHSVGTAVPTHRTVVDVGVQPIPDDLPHVGGAVRQMAVTVADEGFTGLLRDQVRLVTGAG